MPRRAVLRLAGVLTQLTGASCLLVGTIAFVLVQQNKGGGTPLVIAWVATAMAGLVFGGLVYRGSTISLIASTAIDAGCGLTLLLIDAPQLRRLLRILPASDVVTIGTALNGVAIGMLVAAGLCLVAIPQARRYARWVRDTRELEAAESAASGFAPGTVALVVGPASGELVAPRLTPPVIPTSASTARGFPPPPVPATRPTVTLLISPIAEARTLRRTYMALGGLAIGVGAGIGVLVSAHSAEPGSGSGAVVGSGSAKAGSGSAKGQRGSVGAANVGSNRPTPTPGVPGDAVVDTAPVPAPVGESVQALITAQRAALVKGDAHALAALVAPTAFGFGVDADEAGEGREAIEAQLRHDLGDAPPGGFTVDSKLLKIGEVPDHAWIAEELEIGAAGQPSRLFAITQLAANVAGHWQVVAWEWGLPVADATVERLAILGTLPVAKLVADRHDGSAELAAAVHTAFGTRTAFADARSEREDAFNFGSAPGEHVVGGVLIKRIFGKLRAELRLHDGARVADGSVWDPAQKTLPVIGWSAVNVDFTTKTRAATDVTQTFRVLAIWIREGSGWRIVQTQFSNGGPIR